MSTRHIIRILGLALIGLSLWLAWPSTDVVHANPSLDPDAGKKVWDAKQCKNCHGANAEGKFGPPLAGLARNAKTLDDFVKQVRTPFRNMPAWSTDQISDADLADLVDWLKTLTPNPDWKFAAYQPAAGEDPGKTLFNQKLCAACHGENADRIIAQSVKGTGRTTITPAEVLKQVRTPRKNMPTFKTTTVTDDDVATLSPFIKAAVEKALANPAPATTPAPTPVPATLPKTGEDALEVPWALGIGLAGITLIAASFILRRRSVR